MGMHFSVVCAEDVPRLASATDKPGADFGNTDAQLYQQTCKTWPRGEVPAAFYSVPPAPSPVLVLSGGADPVTPPRHGERVAKLLGSKAQHIVVPEAGHGVMGVGCMREVLFRFIDAKTDAAALPQDAGLRHPHSAPHRVRAGAARRRSLQGVLMIHIDKVSKHFVSRSRRALCSSGRRRQIVHAVQGVTLDAPNGRITGLLGANGAGKTTTLRMLGGLFQPDGGSITVDGIAVATQPRQALARMGILGDAHGLYPRLSARENIVYFGRLQGMDADAANARADGAGPAAGHGHHPGPPRRGLQPGRAHEDGPGPRPGA